MTSFLLATALFLGCAGKRAEPTPVWSTPHGREQARIELARTLVDHGSPEAALSLIGQIRAGGGKGAEIDLVQGRAMRQIGLLDDAAAVLAQSVKRHPRDSALHNEMGILEMDRKDLDAAVARFQRAVHSDPKDSNLHNNLGFALLASGRVDEAVEVLRVSLRLDGSQIRTRNNLGFALVAVGKPEAAWRVFRAASAEPDARTNYALALELKGEVDAAATQYRTALKLDPKNSQAREGLSRITPPETDEVEP